MQGMRESFEARDRLITAQTTGHWPRNREPFAYNRKATLHQTYRYNVEPDTLAPNLNRRPFYIELSN